MGEKFHKFFVISARLAFLVYFGMVLYVCFGHFDDLPDMSQPIWGIPQDKIIHFIMFFPFPILAAMALDLRPRRYGKAFLEAFLLLVCGLVIAAATEIGQSFTDYRDPSIWDWVADISALVSSALIVLIVLLFKVRRSCRESAVSAS
ncbi:MAG: VanZ family protein [Bacteroidota bacterium]|nr:VanZ family protein [Bacteroidota bacterium]